jgi:hypothetical protein
MTGDCLIEIDVSFLFRSVCKKDKLQMMLENLGVEDAAHEVETLKLSN